MFSARRGLALCTAAVFAATIIPMTAFAGADPAHGELKPPGLRAQANVAPDSYEFDDTTATAKPMPTASYHTWHPLAGGANDVDFMYFTVEETGTPIYLETWIPGKATSFSDPYIKVYDEEGALNVAQQPFDFDGALVSSDDHLDASLDAGLVFVAPHPGKYYVRLQSDDWGSGQWGEYWLFARRGIVRRISGPDRYATGVAVSQLYWNGASNAEGGFMRGRFTGIVLSSGLCVADAMNAGMLAGVAGSPLLLTNGPNSVTPGTQAEITRLAAAAFWSDMRFKGSGPGDAPFGKLPIYIVGGSASVSSALAAKLARGVNIGEVIRIGGPDRYVVGAKVMDTIMDMHATRVAKGLEAAKPNFTAFVASGDSPSDVCAAAPVAAACCSALLLTRKGSLPASTTAWLDHHGITQVVLVGGTGTVSEAVATRLASIVGPTKVQRLSGATRYETCKKLVDYEIDHADTVNTRRMVLVSGVSIPDAMTAVPLTVAMGYAPLLFTRPASLSSEVKAYIDDNAPLTMTSYLLGGTGSVMPGTFNQVNAYGWPFRVSPYETGAN